MTTKTNAVQCIDDVDLLTPEEVADLLDIKRAKAYWMIRTGELPAVRVGEKSVRVLKADLLAYDMQSYSAGH